MTFPAFWRRIKTPRNRNLAIVFLALLPVIWWVAALSRGRFSQKSEKNPAISTQPATDTSGMNNMPGMVASGSALPGAVYVSADQRARYGITLGVASLRPLATETRTTGIVTVDETRVAEFAPKVAGVAERLFVNFTGQPVRRGQPLIGIYSPDLIAAQQDLLLALSLRRAAGGAQIPGVPDAGGNLVEAARNRLRLADISTAEVAAVERSGRVRRMLTLTSPASGVVIQKNVVQGQAVAAGQNLYTIADLSQLWVELQMRESDAAAVHNGSVAYLSFAALPGRELSGRVSYVYPTVDSGARAIVARVILSNPGGSLKPGMYATARLITPSRSALTVPSSAVFHTGERDLVFVQSGSDNFQPREVRTGATAGDYTEILAGVSSGQRVVTSAQFLLDSESNLGEVMRSMIGQAPPGSAAEMQGMQMQDKGARVPPGRR